MSRQVVCFNTVEKVSTLCEFTDSFIDIYVSLLYCHVQCCGAESDVGEIWVEMYRQGQKCRFFRYPDTRDLIQGP